MKHVRHLQQQKAKLSKQFRESKTTYSSCKTKLQENMNQYQSLLQAEETNTTEEEDLTQEGNLEKLLQTIEQDRNVLVSTRDALGKVKAEQEKVEEELVQARAAMAAKSAVLAEDETLRKAIQEDERAKLEVEKEAFLQSALEVERGKMRQELQTKLAEQATLGSNGESWHNQQAALVDQIQRQTQRSTTLEQELVALEEKHGLESQRWAQNVRKHVELLMRGFEEEKKALEVKYHDVVTYLRSAHNDLTHLKEENQKLKDELKRAMCWEPFN